MPTKAIRRTDFLKIWVWETFVRTRETNDVPDHLWQAWLRCKQFAIDPLCEILPDVLDQQAITTRLQKNEDLHQLIRYHFWGIRNKTDLSPFNILFSDLDGYVLSVDGHQKMLQISEDSIIKIGSNLSEFSVGTTSPGHSLVELRPAFIHGEEHFSRIFHWDSCLAIPIFEHKKKMTECLNISTTIENRQKLEQMILFFCTIATSFQFEHFIKRKFQNLKLYSSFFDTRFKYADKILILIDLDMTILNLNVQAKISLGVRPFEVYHRNIIECMNMNAVKFKKILENREVDTFDISTPSGDKFFSIQIIPIYNPAGREISYLLEFKPERKNLVMGQHKQQSRFTFSNIIGTSPQIARIIRRAKKAAKTVSNVLIEGETGTGKELFAHAMHSESPFSNGPFVAVNCSAIPGELIESELFGYEKGAYTGARRNCNQGKFEMANRGTIFLDEIHKMSLSAQMKILRTIEDRSITRIGAKIPIHLNFRIIAAASEKISEEINNGNFLSTLFFRLNVVQLHVPRLIDRKDDIPFLIQYFIKEMNKKFDRTIKGIDHHALNDLLQYTWPGNIRELKNVIESAFSFCDTEMIGRECIPKQSVLPKKSGQEEEYTHIIRTLTKELFIENLNRFGNVKAAANFLGIPKSTFYRKMKKFGLSKMKNQFQIDRMQD